MVPPDVEAILLTELEPVGYDAKQEPPTSGWDFVGPSRSCPCTGLCRRLSGPFERPPTRSGS
jgi:hypothetical protein